LHAPEEVAERAPEIRRRRGAPLERLKGFGKSPVEASRRSAARLNRHHRTLTPAAQQS
jgi:hypothetical protein